MVAPLRLVEGRAGGEPSGAGSVPGSKPSITEQGFAPTPPPKHKNCVRGTHPNRPWPKRRHEKGLKSPLAFGRGCLHGAGHGGYGGERHQLNFLLPPYSAWPPEREGANLTSQAGMPVGPADSRTPPPMTVIVRRRSAFGKAKKGGEREVRNGGGH
ncbi:hypothetical protein ACOMHN_042638 [Nucella lapillus]